MLNRNKPQASPESILGTTAAVNAVAASKVLTVSGLPAELNTVTVGTQEYVWVLSVSAAIAAYNTFSVTGTPAAGNTFTIGSKTYTYRASIAGVKGTSTGTFTNPVANTKIITLDTTVYTFRTALTEKKASGTITVTGTPVALETMVVGPDTYTFVVSAVLPGDITIDADNTTQATNIKNAINSLSTAVTAASSSGVVTVTAATIGTAGNSIVFTEAVTGVAMNGSGVLGGTQAGVNAIANEIKVGATPSVAKSYFLEATTGGANIGVDYSTGTVAHTTVDVTSGAGDTVTATYKTVGLVGNVVSTTNDSSNFAWTGATLAGGLDAYDTANNVLIGASATAAKDNAILAITAGSGAGTNYGTGTVASTQVTAVSASSSTATITALATGVAGNSIATTNVGANLSFDSATLLHGEAAQTDNGVLIGVNAEACIDNLVLAVTGGAGSGTNYSSDLTANPDVTAVKASPSTMTATARVKGAGGNTIVVGEVGSNTSWAGGATHLSSGVDGTVGFETTDGDFLYVATNGYNTISDDSWKKVALSSL